MRARVMRVRRAKCARGFWAFEVAKNKSGEGGAVRRGCLAELKPENRLVFSDRMRGNK